MASGKSLPYDPSVVPVLIVDDHPQIRKAMRKLLDDAGYCEIFEAGSVEDAVRIIEEQRLELVILDLYLHKLNGIAVLELIRNRQIAADLPVLIVTGEASKEEIVKASDKGADDYLVKPFQKESFLEKVEKILSDFHLPSPHLSLIRKAEQMYVDGAYADALMVVQEALDSEKESVRALHLKAIILDRYGDSAQAEKLLKQVTEVNENFYRAYASLAEIYLRQERPKEAIEAMLAELELNPRQTHRQTQVATLLFREGKIDAAIEHYREALKEDVRYRLALFGMARAYLEIGNVDKAIYYYKRVRRYYPNNTHALEAIVKACISTGDPQKAEHTLKDEKNNHKARMDTYIVLSKFYLLQERKDDALAILKEALSIQPDNVEVIKLKIAIHQKHAEMDQAILQYKELIAKAPTFENMLPYCDLLFQNKDYFGAISVLHQITKRPHNQKSVLGRIALCYLKTNQIAKAHIVYLQMIRSGLADAKMQAHSDKCAELLRQRRSQIKSRIAS